MPAFPPNVSENGNRSAKSISKHVCSYSWRSTIYISILNTESDKTEIVLKFASLYLHVLRLKKMINYKLMRVLEKGGVVGEFKALKLNYKSLLCKLN